MLRKVTHCAGRVLANTRPHHACTWIYYTACIDPNHPHNTPTLSKTHAHTYLSCTVSGNHFNSTVQRSVVEAAGQYVTMMPPWCHGVLCSWTFGLYVTWCLTFWEGGDSPDGCPGRLHPLSVHHLSEQVEPVWGGGREKKGKGGMREREEGKKTWVTSLVPRPRPAFRHLSTEYLCLMINS